MSIRFEGKMTCGFLWWLTRRSKNALPDFMLARLNYAKLSSNYQEFNQSYALLAGRSKLRPSLRLKRGIGLPPSLEP
jgi:hypothetical protein